MSRKRILTSALALAAASALVFASPALAHDELISSTPEAGQSLETVPEEITLTYSANIMTEGADVTVIDAAGTDWSDGEPIIENETLRLAVKQNIPAGAYEIQWKVVSSDGHPISNTTPFSIAEPAVETDESVPGPDETTTEVEESPEPQMTTMADATPDPDEDTSDPTDGSGAALPLTIAAAVVGGAIVILVVALIVRRKKNGSNSAT